YYYAVWSVHGRNLRTKSIIPLFEPPKNFTPEALRFIKRMGYDIKTFTTALVNMATNGYLTIKNNAGECTLTKTSDANITLPIEEQSIADEIFNKNSSITLIESNRDDIVNAKNGLKSKLKNLYQDKYFV